MFRCIATSFFFFFKQKTAYEMRISDWSSDVCSSDLELDLNSVEPSLAGPKRPQDRVALSGVAASAEKALEDMGSGESTPAEGTDYTIDPAHVVIAAITSCTNTSNPSVLVAAGLLAKKANEDRKSTRLNSSH